MPVSMPAAERTMAVLTELAAAAGPVTVAHLARAVDMPTSSMYQLLQIMGQRGFVQHLPQEGRWALGVSAYAVGAGYTRHASVERLARPLLTSLASQAERIAPVVAHLSILHGRETLYLLKESSTHPVTIITDVGVRLPASLTASGRALLSRLAPAQVRALFPSRQAFVDRTGRGPMNLPQLQRLLAQERAQGCAVEDGFISPGLASVAAAAVDHMSYPAAAIGLTFRTGNLREQRRLASAVVKAAAHLSQRLGAQ
jgi:DNA-binding IclR family transcriptional regulator